MDNAFNARDAQDSDRASILGGDSVRQTDNGKKLVAQDSLDGYEPAFPSVWDSDYTPVARDTFTCHLGVFRRS